MKANIKSLAISLIMTAPMLLFNSHSSAFSQLPDNIAGPQVITSAGIVEGEVKDKLAIFKGIPFAAPPIGDLRFHPPVAAEPWQGVRESKEFSDICPQDGVKESNALYAQNLVADEDCLYLNIWTPQTSSHTDPQQANKTRPVMVWVHGGGLLEGSGAHSVYNGDLLADKGDVVVVTLNYRLGLLGSLAHPALTDPETGNYANWHMQDVLAALNWVQDNIAAFGGDANNVTLFGESAGSWISTSLMASALSDNLFSRVISQSGVHALRSKEPAAEHANQVFSQAGCLDDNDLLNCMRALDLDTLMEINRDVFAGSIFDHPVHDPLMPVLDGIVFDQSIKSALTSGRGADIELIIGSNEGELGGIIMGDRITTIGKSREQVIDQLADTIIPGKMPDGRRKADVLWQRYEEASWAKLQIPFKGEIYGQIKTDEFYRMHATRFAEYHQAGGGRSYMYLMTYATNLPLIRSFHGLEIPFVFGHLKLGHIDFSWEPMAQRVRDEIQESWLNFAHGRGPYTNKSHWPLYNEGERATLLFSNFANTLWVGPSQVKYRYDESRRAAWDEIDHHWFN